MTDLEVIARCKIRPGQLEGFTSQVAEILAATTAHDAHTVRCDWFINDDSTECEVHESFADEHGLIEHKMNTMEATQALFRDFAFDHHATIYGEVSQEFIRVATERMGPPTVFRQFQGLGSPAPILPGHLEVIANLSVRPGRLAGFMAGVAEILRLTQEKDSKTLRYDWFINDEQTECEVHEAYASEDGLIEHNHHVVEARDALFRDFAFGHRMSAYGEISQQLVDLAVKHAGGIRRFSYLCGLDRSTV